MRIVVIGATGQIGTRVVAIAHRAGHQVIGVSRHTPDRPPVDWHPADASDPEQLAGALADADRVIATLGLRYDIGTWRDRWVPLARSVTAAVRAAGVPLVWLDNCYPYGITTAPITEDTPFVPVSRMGQVRADVAEVLAGAVQEGARITVARAADFLGRNVDTTLVAWSGLEKAARSGRRTRLTWIGDPDTRHAYASADEVAEALVALATGDPGVTPDGAPGATWLLPALEPVTGREICALLARHSGHDVTPATLPKPLLTVAGWVSPLVRASNDMAYLSDHDFLVDDSRFRSAYAWRPRGTVAGLLDHEL